MFSIASSVGPIHHHGPFNYHLSPLTPSARLTSLAKLVLAVALTILSLGTALLFKPLYHSIRKNWHEVKTGLKINPVEQRVQKVATVPSNPPSPIPIFNPPPPPTATFPIPSVDPTPSHPIPTPLDTPAFPANPEPASPPIPPKDLVLEFLTNQARKAQEAAGQLSKIDEKKRKGLEKALFDKKMALMTQARQVDLAKKDSSSLETHLLRNERDFELDAKKQPAYFQQLFQPSETTFHSCDNDQPPSKYDVVIGWGHMQLGGHCFGLGFGQEEARVYEMPALADLIMQHLSSPKNLCTLLLRQGPHPHVQNRVLQGNPKPLLINHLHRVQSIDNKVYGQRFNTLSQQDLLGMTTILPQPQKVNLLMLAAPSLAHAVDYEQWHLNTLKDLFNTLMAGLTLAKEQTKKGEELLIHAHKTQGEAFHHSVKACYLLQRLAAQQLGIALKLEGYKAQEAQDCNKTWLKLQPDFKNKTLEACLILLSKKALKEEI